jgi:uncharacterized damage-inducible protein DinB
MMATQYLTSSAINGLYHIYCLLIQLAPKQYASKLPILFESSIGMHVRHILEFYQCFLVGVETGIINYDHRKRDIELQNDTVFAKEILSKLIRSLESLKIGTQLLLISAQDHTDRCFEIPSHTDRELTYLIEHAIHHMAIIKMAVSEHFPEVQLPEHFGVAYSTIKYKETCVQ